MSRLLVERKVVWNCERGLCFAGYWRRSDIRHKDVGFVKQAKFVDNEVKGK